MNTDRNVIFTFLFFSIVALKCVSAALTEIEEMRLIEERQREAQNRFKYAWVGFFFDATSKPEKRCENVWNEKNIGDKPKKLVVNGAYYDVGMKICLNLLDGQPCYETVYWMCVMTITYKVSNDGGSSSTGRKLQRMNSMIERQEVFYISKPFHPDNECLVMVKDFDTNQLNVQAVVKNCK